MKNTQQRNSLLMIGIVFTIVMVICGCLLCLVTVIWPILSSGDEVRQMEARIDGICHNFAVASDIRDIACQDLAANRNDQQDGFYDGINGWGMFDAGADFKVFYRDVPSAFNDVSTTQLLVQYKDKLVAKTYFLYIEPNSRTQPTPAGVWFSKQMQFNWAENQDQVWFFFNDINYSDSYGGGHTKYNYQLFQFDKHTQALKYVDLTPELAGKQYLVKNVEFDIEKNSMTVDLNNGGVQEFKLPQLSFDAQVDY